MVFLQKESVDTSPTEEKPQEQEEEEVPSTFKCQVCKAEFDNEKTLTHHKRSHGLAYLQHQLSRSPEKATKPSVPMATPVPETAVKPPEPAPTRCIDTDSSEDSAEEAMEH